LRRTESLLVPVSISSSGGAFFRFAAAFFSAATGSLNVPGNGQCPERLQPTLARASSEQSIIMAVA